jgi:arylsulfatase A-like enzyme
MKPNIFLVVFDTARADIVSDMMEEGHLRHLSSLAESGTSFTNAFSTSPLTLPSHASIFIGQRSYNHGTNYDSPEFDPSATPLAEALQEIGYSTFGISGNPWISPEFGFDRGFDHFSMKWDAFWRAHDLTSAFGAESIVNKISGLLRGMSLANAPKTILNAIYAQLLDGVKVRVVR